METWRCWRFLALVTIACASSSSALRLEKAITWADILKGKSGYPSVSLQGYQSNNLNQEIKLPGPIRATSTSGPTSTITPVFIRKDSLPSQKDQDTKSTIKNKEPLSSKSKSMSSQKTYSNPQLEKQYFHTTTSEPMTEETTVLASTNKYEYEKTTSPTKTNKNMNYFREDKWRSRLEIPKKELTTTTTTTSTTTTTTPIPYVAVTSETIPVNTLPSTYDFNYVDDYDESFFNNNYYEYVDSEDIPEIVEEEVSNSDANDENKPQEADRRALDFLYHMFMDPSRHGNKEKRPFLIEEVFETIDKHIIDDVQAWSQNHGSANNILSQLYQQPAQQVATASPAIFLPPIADSAAAASGSPLNGVNQNTLDFLTPSIGGASSGGNIKQPAQNNNVLNKPKQAAGHYGNTPGNNIGALSPNLSGDKFLVTDEIGKQYVVSIDDIITSLAQLDERQITDLFIGDTQSTGIPLSDANAAVQSAALPAALPGSVERPTRQIDNDVVPNNDEVFVIKNKEGDVQIITMNDILKSLENYENKKIEQSPYQSNGIDLDALSNLIKENQQRNLINNNNPQKLISQNQNPILLSNPVSSSSIIKNNNKGNLHLSLLNAGQPSRIDVRDKHVHYSEPQQRPKHIQESLVKTDSQGNVHIYPNPNEPFRLDINEIINIAENAESERRITTSTTTTTETPKTGEDILGFLIGGAENLPRPIRSSKPSGVEGDALKDNSAQLQLISTDSDIKQTQTSSNDLLELLRSQAQRIVPPTRYFQQLVPNLSSFHPVRPQTQAQPQEQGFTSTLTDIFSRFIGRDENSQTVPGPSVASVPKPNHVNDVVRLVVRQQDRGSQEQIFGHVNIELPKAIHYQDTTIPPTVSPTHLSNSDSNRRVLDLGIDLPSNVQSRKIRKTAHSPQRLTSAFKQAKIPTKVQNFLLTQLNDKPKFKIPNAPAVDKIQSREDSSYTSISAGNSYEQNSYYSPNPVESGYTYEYSEPQYGYQALAQPHTSVTPRGRGMTLFDLNLLADVVKVEKIGKKNKSVILPKIGDASEFVNTRKYHYYRR